MVRKGLVRAETDTSKDIKRTSKDRKGQVATLNDIKRLIRTVKDQ